MGLDAFTLIRFFGEATSTPGLQVLDTDTQVEHLRLSRNQLTSELKMQKMEHVHKMAAALEGWQETIWVFKAQLRIQSGEGKMVGGPETSLVSD